MYTTSIKMSAHNIKNVLHVRWNTARALKQNRQHPLEELFEAQAAICFLHFKEHKSCQEIYAELVAATIPPPAWLESL